MHRRRIALQLHGLRRANVAVLRGIECGLHTIGGKTRLPVRATVGLRAIRVVCRSRLVRDHARGSCTAFFVLNAYKEPCAETH